MWEKRTNHRETNGEHHRLLEVGHVFEDLEDLPPGHSENVESLLLLCFVPFTPEEGDQVEATKRDNERADATKSSWLIRLNGTPPLVVSLSVFGSSWTAGIAGIDPREGQVGSS